MEIKEVFNGVCDEINRIVTKAHPECVNNTMDRWLAVIGEEYGEMCRAINDKEKKNFIVECIQTMSAITLMLKQYTADMEKENGKKDI